MDIPHSRPCQLTGGLHGNGVWHVSFSYDGADRDYVLDDICLNIPEKKVTAIVGASGSGKSTLLKLIVGFYEPNRGNIRIGDTPLNFF